MTVDQETPTDDGELVCVNFNQDYSCISVGTKTGYIIYSCDPFAKYYSKCKILIKQEPSRVY
jgi:autophagy-related protein 18